MAITKFFYTQIEDDPSGIRQYILDTHPASPICKECGAKMKSKGTSRTKDKPRIIYDIDADDGKPVKIKYWPKKYRCINANCGKVVPDPNTPELIREKGSEDFRTYIAEEALSHSQWSVKDAGKKYGVSAGYVSESIKKLLEKHKATIVSFESCSRLHIELADCYQASCYVVFGYADKLKMWVLLDIVEAGKYKQIVDLCDKVSTPKEICCPLDPQLVKILKEKFPKVLLKIPTDSFLSYLNDYADMVIEQRSDDIEKLVIDTVGNIRIKVKMGFTSLDNMKKWWMGLATSADDDLYAPNFQEPSFPEIYEDLQDHCIEGLYRFQEKPYQVPDCVGRIQTIMGRLYKARTPIEVVQLRLQYQAEFFRRTLKQNKQMIYRGGYSFAGVPGMPHIEEWVNCYTVIPLE